MTTILAEAIVPLAASEYWAVFCTQAFDEFSAPFVGIRSIEEVAKREEDGVLYRSTRVTPSVNLPAPVRWLLGNKEFTILDHSAKRLDRFEHKVTTIPPVLKDRVTAKSFIKLIPIDGESCRQVLECTISCRVLGVGRLVVSVLARELQRSYTMIPEVIHKWKQYKAATLHIERPLSVQQEDPNPDGGTT